MGLLECDRALHADRAPTQAQSAIAAAILRQLYAVVIGRRAWDPLIAAHRTQGADQAAKLTAA